MMKAEFFTRRLVVLFLFVIILASFGCGGVDPVVKTESAPSKAALQGVFWDGPVSGLHYATATVKGVTSGDGSFTYQPGETVTFSIGSLVLGSTIGKPVVTPLDMVPLAKDASDPRVVNICVVLQTLDADGNPDNGITISEKVAAVVSQYGKSIQFDKPVRAFSFDNGLRSAMAELNQMDAFGETPRAVKPPVAAQRHLEMTLIKLKEKK